MKPVHVISILAIAGFIVIGGATLLYHRLATAGVESFLGRGGYYAINTKANAEYSSGDYQAAIADYGRMIAMNPNKVDGYYLRGMAYYKCRMFSNGAADDTQVLHLLDTPEGVAELGFGHDSPQQKQANVVIERSDALVCRGLCYQAQGQNTRAVVDFTSALQVDPHVHNGHGARANSYKSLQQYSLALADCNIDVAEHPRSGRPYLLRGEVLDKLGRNSQSAADFRKCIALNPQESQGYYRLTSLQEKIGDFKGAVETSRIAMNSNPDNPGYLGNYGWEQYLAGDISGAITSDKKALPGLRNAAWVQANLALCYATQGDWESASSEYVLMKAHATPKDLAGALGDVTNALKKHPDSDALKKADAFLRS